MYIREENDLKRLMRLNEKKRQLKDGKDIMLDGFSIHEVCDRVLPTINVDPVSYSRESEGKENV